MLGLTERLVQRGKAYNLRILSQREEEECSVFLAVQLFRDTSRDWYLSLLTQGSDKELAYSGCLVALSCC